MFKRTQEIYTELAKELGVASVPTAEDGSVQLTVDTNSTVNIFSEDEASLLLASAVMPLPKKVQYASALWLMRRNFYDSPIAPFRVSCDTAGSIVVWGRVPTEGLTGKALADLIAALGKETDFIRQELNS